MKLATFETCIHGHPLEWNATLECYVCPTCEDAMAWISRLVKRVEQLNPNPIRPIQGPGFVMIRDPAVAAIRERLDRNSRVESVVAGMIGSLAVLGAAALVLYLIKPSILNL